MNAETEPGKRAPHAEAPDRADGRPTARVERREILRDYGRTRTLITVDVEIAPPRPGRSRRADPSCPRRTASKPASRARSAAAIPPWEADPSKPRIVRLSSGPITLSPSGVKLPSKPRRHRRTAPRAGADLWVDKPLLKRRGWTETAIREFLPKPERLKRNPHPRGRRRPMPLWRPKTVAKVEASEQWRQWLEASLQRRGTTLTDLSKTFPANRYRDMGAAADPTADAADAAVDAAIEAHDKRRGTRPT